MNQHAEVLPTPPLAHILLVDDDLDSLGSIARFLRLAGYGVTVASDAPTAHRRLAQAETRFDAVITDLKMPGESGLDLCLAIRKAAPAVPVILISGMAQTHDVVAAMQMGALTFLEKPVEPESLLSNLERALGRGIGANTNTDDRTGDTGWAGGGMEPLPERVRAFEAALIEDALRQSGGRVKEAMEILGVGRRTLNDKMARLGIDRRLIRDR